MADEVTPGALTDLLLHQLSPAQAAPCEIPRATVTRGLISRGCADEGRCLRPYRCS
jgi:hypothetical protein